MKTKRPASALALAACTLLSACATTLESAPAAPGGSAGHEYGLQFTQYTVTITRRLLTCESNNFRASVKVEITAASVDDGAHTYVINQNSLQRPLNTVTLNAENYENSRALKSINVEVQDQGVAVIRGVISGVGRLIRLGGGAGLETAANICTPEVANLPGRAQTLAARVETLTTGVEDQTALVARLRTQRAELGDTPAGARVAAQLVRAQGVLRTKSAQLQTAQTALTRALQAITATQIIRWPETSTVFASERYRLPEATARRWFVMASNESLVSRFDVYLQLERIGSVGLDPTTATAAALAEAALAEPTVAGIRYRNPVRGRLVACDVTPCRSDNPAHILQTFEGPVSQLAPINVLEVRARPLESMAFSATFSRDGALTSSGYRRLSSLGTALTSIADAAITELETTRAAEQGSRQAELDAELKELQARVAIQTAQRALQPNANEAAAEATAAANAQAALYNAETSITQAQIAQIQAQRQLEALRPTD